MALGYALLLRHGSRAASVASSSGGGSRLSQASRSTRPWSGLPNSSERRLRRLSEEADVRSQDPEAQAMFLRALGEIRPAEVISRVESGAHVPGAGVAREYIKALVKTGDLKKDKLPTMLGVLGTVAAYPAAALTGAAVATSAAEPSNAFGAVASSAAPPKRFAGNTAFAVNAPPAGSTTNVELTGLAGMTGAAGAAGPSSTTVGSANPAPLAAAAAGGGGSNNASPLYVALAEPSAQSQLWRLVRVLGTTFLLLGFLGVLVEERGGGGMARINTSAEPEPESSDPCLFSDVAGADEAKEELQEMVEYLRSPASFTKLGGRLPKGVLLVGPPGTGKTLLARAVAGEAHRPFFYAAGSSFEELYVGVGAKRVRELFAAAKRKAPCIVFIDEIDAIGGKRNPKDSSYMKLTLNELLVQLDGFSSNDNVIVIAATNSPESLDPALVRPGRFDRHVVVPNPDVVGRLKILTVHTKSIPTAPDVELEIIARGTPGFSGADLANLANMAAIKAAVDRCEEVSMTHFEHAKDRILMGAERRSAAISDSTRRLTAYHEGGHGLMAIYTEGALPVHKATIVPRGQSLGMVSQLPDKDMTSMSRQQMMARLLVCMGGRAAEELIFGEDHITSGAESDFAQATNLAEAMVTRYGMSEKLGHVVYERESQSPETRAVIEREIKSLLDGSYEKAKSVLCAHQKELHNLAAALIERETLRGEEVRLAAEGRLPPLAETIGAKVAVAVPGDVPEKAAVLDAPSAANSAAPQ